MKFKFKQRTTLILIKLAVLGLFLSPSWLLAQSPSQANLTAQSTNCATANSCLSIATFTSIVPYPGAAGFVISSTSAFVGTIQFEASSDGGATWQSLSVTPSNGGSPVTSAATGGLWQANIAGYTNVRMRCSTYVSGVIVVSLELSQASAKSNGSGGGGSGSVTNVSGTTNQIDVATGTTTPVISLDAGIITCLGGAGKTINGVSYSTCYTGASLDIRVNSCLSDAMSRANGNTTGICSSFGEPAILTTTGIEGTINLGDSSGDAVTWLLPGACNWNANPTGGTPVIQAYPGSDLYAFAGQGGHNATNGSGSCFIQMANGGASYMYTTTGSGRFKYHGLSLKDGTHSLSGGSLVNIASGVQDMSLFQDFGVENQDSVNQGVNVGAACCQTTLDNVEINGVYTGGIQLVLNGAYGIALRNVSIDHPQAGNPVIKCQGSSSISIFGLYEETFNGAMTSPMNDISSCRNVEVHGQLVQPLNSGAVAPMTVWQIENTGIAANFQLQGLQATQESLTGPMVAVNNLQSGATMNVDANGNLANYSSLTSYFDNIVGTLIPATNVVCTNASDIFSGTSSCPQATNSALGVAECDGTTITCSAGVMTASAGGVVGYSGSPTVTSTVYVPFSGGGNGSTTVANVGWPAPVAVPISKLHAYSSSVPGSGNTLVVTLYDASSAEAVTCTITAAANACNDATHSFTPAAGDLLTWQIAPTGSVVITPVITITALWGSQGVGTGSFTTVSVSTSVNGYQINGTGVMSYPNSDTTSLALGNSALASQNASSSNNVAIGLDAAQDTTSATDETAIGVQALQTNVTGTGNTAIGYQALNKATTTNNTAIGFQALAIDSTGTSNTAVGKGAAALITTGSEVNAFGALSAQNTTAGPNDFFGYATGAFITTGANNAAFGYEAIAGVSGAHTTGSFNSGLGNQAGLLVQGAAANNTMVGGLAGSTTTTGSNNTVIGKSALANAATDSNEIVIGEAAAGKGPNTTLIGNSSTTQWTMFGVQVPAVLYSAAGTALPSCVAGLNGAQAVVSDATSPTYLGTYTSGGATVAPVVCNGSNWLTY